ncbi:hypothetical protein NYE48_17300 [Paenibacillus sp. FSL M7-1455]|uniref:hypothetical protein n=1 Tax=Paenibacillus sp. FSL M7-1455 TaxID=2975316 RepID=UPI0030F980ED
MKTDTYNKSTVWFLSTPIQINGCSGVNNGPRMIRGLFFCFSANPMIVQSVLHIVSGCRIFDRFGRGEVKRGLLFWPKAVSEKNMYVLVTFCEVVPSIDILESFFIRQNSGFGGGNGQFARGFPDGYT